MLLRLSTDNNYFLFNPQQTFLKVSSLHRDSSSEASFSELMHTRSPGAISRSSTLRNSPFKNQCACCVLLLCGACTVYVCTYVRMYVYCAYTCIYLLPSPQNIHTCIRTCMKNLQSPTTYTKIPATMHDTYIHVDHLQNWGGGGGN